MRWVWCLMLGLNYALMGQYHDAILWLERSIAINPRHWANLAFAAVAYSNVGDLANATRAKAQFEDVYREPASPMLPRQPELAQAAR